MEVSDRLRNIQICAEERATVQRTCFENLDLSNIEKNKGIGKLKYFYEKCYKETSQQYDCLKNK
jgi:hypothetical protein